MCGIAGFVDAEIGLNQAEQLIDGMCQVIRHRGPDDQGTWVGDGAALGMRRLSIIDVSGGNQPIFNEDHSILIVFNGEIYNYLELRDELQARGHHFATNSDTEAIVHAYEEYGDDCVKRLRGMFTFAIWDRKRHRLLAARDRFGKKPLNYYWDGQRLIFGSEIKSILQAGIPREVNPIALDEYLVYRYVPTPNTLFKNVMKLPAAHILIYEHGQVSTRRYWELPFTPTCQDDEATASERILELLKDAVKVRLMSEVPLGAFLSGGVDSSVVVGLMSQMMSQPVKTFSIGFEEDYYSELPYARQIAQHFDTEHHEFFVRPELISVLPQLVWAYDEPFADASMLPTYYVSKLAREYVTVALTGDGGDEIFGGYVHYERELMTSRIPLLMRLLLGYGSLLMPNGMRGKKRFHNMLYDHARRNVCSTTLFPENSRHAMYSRDYFERVCDHDPFERLLSQYRNVPNLDVTASMQYVDARVYLTDDILVKVDKASMFNSLETRAPLLDQHLVEYVASLPSSLRLQNGVLKYLLKKVALDMVPAETVNRPKHGFSVPIKQWFRGDLFAYARELLESPRAQQRGIFNPQFVSNMLKTHASTKLVNFSEAIWALVCLELWFQVYIDEPPLRVVETPQIQVANH
ncbi:MAG TPA: asparagine synthase (glutamine-hydrolyzing) [Ktedonobacteraceae bacterium]|nr:asparagine synthase (glutamine-hydrolyzing) [Ktedonobacteraceae bacterium]